MKAVFTTEQAAFFLGLTHASFLQLLLTGHGPPEVILPVFDTGEDIDNQRLFLRSSLVEWQQHQHLRPLLWQQPKAFA